MSNPTDKVDVRANRVAFYLTTDVDYYVNDGDLNYCGVGVTDAGIGVGTVSGTFSALGSGSNRYDARAFIRSDIDYFQGVGQLGNGTWSVVTDTVQASPKFTRIYSKENEVPIAISNLTNVGDFECNSTGTGSKFVKVLDANGTVIAEGYYGVGLLRSFILPTEDPARANLTYRTFTYDQAVALIGCCNMDDQTAAERWASGLMLLQQANYWWPFGGNTMSGQQIDPYYRTGAGMWCAYSLLWFAKKYPLSAYAAQAKTAAKNFIDMCLSTIYVGSVASPQYGTFTLGSGKYIISATEILTAGAGDLGNIGGDVDQCGMLYETVTGNGTLECLVWEMDPITNTEAKGGLMFREGTHRSDEMVFFGQMPNDGVNLNWRLANRTSFGGASVDTSGTCPAQVPLLISPAACWYRLVRDGSTFIASVSSDRYNWYPAGYAINSAIPHAAVAGLAATSRSTGNAIGVSFAEVHGFAGTYALLDLGPPDPASSYTHIDPGVFGGAYLFDPLYTPTASSTEHNVDAYFVLKLASEVLADPSYLARANLIANFLVTYIFTGSSNGRCLQGYSPDGPDDYLALDCHSWYSMAVRDAGYGSVADLALGYCENFSNTEVYTSGTSTGTATGYTAYIYPDMTKSEGIWVEGTYGVILAKVAAGSRAQAVNQFDALAPLKGDEGFPTKTRVDQAADQQLWTALGGTGWGLLAARPRGFWGVTENIDPSSPSP